MIDAGLVNKMKTDAGLAYGHYGAVEAEAAEEEMQEMADWDDLIQVLNLLASLGFTGTKVQILTPEGRRAAVDESLLAFLVQNFKY